MTTTPPAAREKGTIFGLALRAVRLRLGLDQKALASRLGVSVGTLKAWEAGRRPPPGSARTLLRLLRQEGLSPLPAEVLDAIPAMILWRGADGSVRFRNRAFAAHMPGATADRRHDAAGPVPPVAWSERRFPDGSLLQIGIETSDRLRFLDLFRNMRSGAAICTAIDGGSDFIITDLNTAGEQIGRADRSVIGRRLSEAFPGAEPFGLLQVMGDVWRTGRPASIPDRYYRDERFEGWRECYVYKLTTGEVVVVFTDVSERVAATRARRQSELRVRTLLDASRDEILLLSKTGVILAINEAARVRLERRTGGVDPLGAKFDQVLPAGAARSRLAVLHDVVTTAKVAHFEEQIRQRWFEFWFVPVGQPGRSVEEVALYAREITERKRTEEQLRQSQKLQAIGQLTGGIAHDFNNLLAIIVGNLQLLQERLSGSNDVKDLLADAVWSAKRGAELTHRLLAFARRQALNPEVVNLNNAVRNMTQLLRRTLGAGIEVRERLAPDLAHALVDPGELERALINLALNARDAMPGGGVLTIATRNVILGAAAAAALEETEPGDYTLLEVIDTGTGMTTDVVKKAFEPFFTTKDVGEGSGLGLSMVYGFAKQSGGHVLLESTPEHGTTVKLFLPRASNLTDRKRTAAASIEWGSGRCRGRAVLVVEDEAKLRKVAVTMLRQLGCEVVGVGTAAAALAHCAAAGPIDVLFTDIELPGGMNGIELAARLRAQRPDIAVIYATGHATEAIAAKPDDAAVLAKPYAWDELAHAIAGVLGARADEERAPEAPPPR
ncbi:MAG: response regulator [Defluviicoccus sp.]|nr:response regulator [Defluviicoccus sp.]MDG4609754.1 response regulator [Defluviicoccus sp.]